MERNVWVTLSAVEQANVPQVASQAAGIDGPLTVGVSLGETGGGSETESNMATETQTTLNE